MHPPSTRHSNLANTPPCEKYFRKKVQRSFAHDIMHLRPSEHRRNRCFGAFRKRQPVPFSALRWTAGPTVPTGSPCGSRPWLQLFVGPDGESVLVCASKTNVAELGDAEARTKLLLTQAVTRVINIFHSLSLSLSPAAHRGWDPGSESAQCGQREKNKTKTIALRIKPRAGGPRLRNNNKYLPEPA